MTDTVELVKRLQAEHERLQEFSPMPTDAGEAADTIERLEARAEAAEAKVKALTEALLEIGNASLPGQSRTSKDRTYAELWIGHLRAKAQIALKGDSHDT